ncbi:MAG TPA: hypothetical protein VFW78_13865 [Bacteroidia bacterium]|nr:hypothetical protein [Bacteroidia bacterium]
MSKKIVLSEISSLIEMLKEQQEQIMLHEDNIPRIELDIMQANVRKLYEMLHLLSKEQTAPKAEPIQQAPVAVEPKIEIESTPAQESNITIPQVTEEKSLLQPEELLAAVEPEVTVTVSATVTEETVSKSASTIIKKKVSGSTASLFDEPSSLSSSLTAQPTVYDKISSTSEDKSLSRKMQSDPVSDLKKSIGINEKFSFINELFDGDLDSYNRAIEQLNTCDGIGSALSLLESSYSQEYNWNTQSNSYLNLRRLVERRYA